MARPPARVLLGRSRHHRATHTLGCAAAEILGLAPGSVRGAVTRGVFKAEKIARRSLIPAAELARYQREVQGTQGWQTCKEPGYQPNAKQRTYQQAYYQRRKAARRQPIPERTRNP